LFFVNRQIFFKLTHTSRHDPPEEPKNHFVDIKMPTAQTNTAGSGAQPVPGQPMTYAQSGPATPGKETKKKKANKTVAWCECCSACWG
jgi:hypothetical protein